MDSEKIRGSRWYHVLIGIGLVSYGLVHIVLAWLAGKVALGGGGDASSQGAMRQLAKQPLGAVLLWVMAIGLFSLVLWQVLVAIVGQESPDPKRRLARRASSIGRAIVYAALGVIAVRVAIGSGGSSSGSAEDTASSKLMHLPAGRFLVAAVGIAIVAVGVSQVVKGIRRKFIERDLDGSAPRPVGVLGSVGWIAKGIVLGGIGVLFLVAAITYDAKKAGGMDQALTALRDQPFGPVLLFAVAAGLAAFGVYCFFWARHPKY
ncbi:DUF1206 domain-containing protein [Microlunatus ginsengisoli]|uniref:DUF1206 domain-containing protein n=1 Tax=Microlunatus ginsengisoli TaxID=363863 RepID=A0ABP7AMU9_9ACTN